MISSTFEGRVRSMSSEGLGVVEGPDGLVYFVPAVWVGDRGLFQIVEKKKKFGRAQLLDLTEGSDHRVTPPCPHSGWNEGKCGACPWQFVSYEAQLEAKDQRVQHAMKRLLAEVPSETLKKIWPSPKQFSYRNRAQFKTDGEVLGFVSYGSQKIAPIDDCLILTDGNRQLLRGLKTQLPRPEWKPNKGFDWNSIDVDEDLARELGESFSPSKIVLNKRRPFRQANDEQNLRMKAWLTEKLSSLDRKFHVLELFAGSGNFTETISSLGFAAVCATEVVDAAMENLKAKNLPRIITVEADLFQDSSYARIRSRFPKADVVVLDPPRDGLKEKKGLLQNFHQIQYIAYVSCDLATLTRDLADFVAAGFRLVEVQPLDQFPHTPHIETMAWLEK